MQARSLPDGRRRFDVKYRRGGRYTRLEHGGTFRTAKEAGLRQAKIREWLAAGLNPKTELAAFAKPGRRLDEVAQEWLASRRSWAAGTRAGHEFRLPTILDAFPRFQVDEVTVSEIQVWVAKLEKRYKPGTVRLFVQQLRMILDYADLPTNPARSRRVELPRESRKTIEPPTAAAVVTVISNSADDLRLPLLLMEQLGLRVTEAMSLIESDVDGIRGRVRVRAEIAKTSKPRWVPTPELLVDALMEQLPFRGGRSRVAGTLRHAKATFSPHDLRHRRASLWVAQQRPPAEVAAWLGHTVDQLLRTYTHVIVDEEIGEHQIRNLLRSS